MCIGLLCVILIINISPGEKEDNKDAIYDNYDINDADQADDTSDHHNDD